jgi:hypothetical protein
MASRKAGSRQALKQEAVLKKVRPRLTTLPFRGSRMLQRDADTRLAWEGTPRAITGWLIEAVAESARAGFSR